MKNIFNKYQYNDLINRGSDYYSIAKYQLILKYIKILFNKPVSILNAGCGSGDLSILLAKEGYNVVGIDPSVKYIKLAKKRALENGVDCKFFIDSIEELDNKKYDCVISTDVLEHIRDDKNAMIKLCDSTKKDGHIIISVPAISRLFGFHDRMLSHFRRYDKKDFKDLLLFSDKSNIIKIRYFGFFLLPVVYWYSYLKEKPYPQNSKNILKEFVKKIILKLFFKIEFFINPPLGISFLGIIKKNN